MEIKLDEPIRCLRAHVIDLCICRISLATILNRQIIAVKAGIMPEDCGERALMMINELKRLIGYFNAQIEAVLELLPDPDYDKIMRELHERATSKTTDI